MTEHPGNWYYYWCIADYGGERIARGLAWKSNRHYFEEKDVKFQFLKPSETEKTDPDKGKMKFWHIEVEGLPTLVDAAWQYVDEAAKQDKACGFGWIAFRAHTSGDSGFGPKLHPTGEPDGVRVDESWFG